jgi:hypothetical protein
MSLLMSFASGFLEGHVAKKKQEADDERLQQEANAAKQKEGQDRLFTLISGGKATQAQINFAAKGLGYSQQELAGLGVAANNVAKTQAFGNYKLNLVQEYDYKTMDGFERSQIFWKSFNNQLSSPGGYQEALAHFKANPGDVKLLGDAVRTNELELRIGNIGRQKKNNVEDAGLTYIDLDGQYGSASRFFDELGFKNVAEEANGAIASQLMDFDPKTEVAVLMNTRETGGPASSIPVVMSVGTHTILKEMATKTGYDDVQHMVSNFSVDADFRKIDETREQFALRQNDLLTKAADLYGLGFADYLANPARMDKAKTASFMKKLQTMTNGDREEQVRIMSMMIGTPPNTFSRPKKFTYSRNNSQSIKAIPTGSMFVEKMTGLKTADFNEGFKAQEDAVQYLDRLQELEAKLAQSVGTGWIRDGMAFAKSFGIQISQGSTTLNTIFSDNSDFSSTASGTNQSDLQATILLVNPTIDLADISESDALKLTLAAKMARAIDPSGRLSNQDFEIQLRRLGDGAFDTPQSIARKLATVRADFEKDLQYKRRLKSVMDAQVELTPQIARSIAASVRMRNLEGQIFGVSGRDKIVGAGQQSPDDSSPETPTVAQPQSLPAYSTSSGTTFYGPDAGGKFYKDPQGTQLVSPAEFRQANQST